MRISDWSSDVCSSDLHHEGLFELAVNLLLHALEVAVLAALGELGAEDLLPVRAPVDLLHALAADQRARARGRLVLAVRGLVQMLVVEVERLVAIVDLRQVGVGEDLGQHPPAPAGARHPLARAGAHPAAARLVLVFPFLGIVDARLGLEVVEPGVLHALARGPHVLAGYRTGYRKSTRLNSSHQ